MKTPAKNDRVAAIILTRNEETNLAGCVRSLQEVADEVYVIDSGSTDATVTLAKEAGASVLQHPFENHSRQMNWAIENIPTDAEWLLRIDADERLSKKLARELRQMVDTAPGDLSGVLVPRRTQFMGKRLRFGGTFPVWLLRTWRSGTGRCEDRWMDEHIVVNRGRVARVQGELLHIIPNSLAEWSRKHVWYAERELLDICGPSNSSELTGQAALVRRAKNSVYYRLPPMVRVLGFWAYRYFVQLGFLDGKIGFLYHFLQCAWYRMLVDGLLEERKRRISTDGSSTSK